MTKIIRLNLVGKEKQHLHEKCREFYLVIVLQMMLTFFSSEEKFNNNILIQV
jgi:hypothetical protein